MTRREFLEHVRRRVERTAWRWNALYPVLFVGTLGVVLIAWATTEVLTGLGALILVPVLVFLSACAALTYLTLFVDARHLRERDDWTVSPWRYVVFVGMAFGVVLVIDAAEPPLDLVHVAGPLLFVGITAVWNLWYAGRRYQYAAS